jgi:hypothetical protein
MTRTRVFLISAAFLGLAGIAGYQARIADRQEREIAVLRRRAAELIADATSLRRQHDATARDLAEAERQLAELPAPPPADPSLSPQRRDEMKAWLGRVKQLRRLFEERPLQRIPELQFLTDQDWLRIAKIVNFESEEGIRRALAAARNTAISNFTQRLTPGLRQLAKSPNADGATTALALLPFLAQPVDATLLDRYELSKISSTRLGGRVEWIVQNKAPVDEDYDSCVRISASESGSFGSSSMPGVLGWIPNFNERLMRAANDYAAAKNGSAPPDVADVIAYFKPPLDPATAEKARRALLERRK